MSSQLEELLARSKRLRDAWEVVDSDEFDACQLHAMQSEKTKDRIIEVMFESLKLISRMGTGEISGCFHSVAIDAIVRSHELAKEALEKK